MPTILLVRWVRVLFFFLQHLWLLCCSLSVRHFGYKQGLRSRLYWGSIHARIQSQQKAWVPLFSLTFHCEPPRASWAHSSNRCSTEGPGLILPPWEMTLKIGVIRFSPLTDPWMAQFPSKAYYFNHSLCYCAVHSEPWHMQVKASERLTLPDSLSTFEAISVISSWGSCYWIQWYLNYISF